MLQKNNNNKRFYSFIAYSYYLASYPHYVAKPQVVVVLSNVLKENTDFKAHGCICFTASMNNLKMEMMKPTLFLHFHLADLCFIFLSQVPFILIHFNKQK